MSRPHRKADRGFRPRPTPGREQRQRFLIVCEGEKSEPAYFRAGYAPVAHVHGAARDPVGVVEKAIELRDRASKDLRMGRPYDQMLNRFTP